MATFSFEFYDVNPFFVFSRTVGGSAVYSGPAEPTGTAVVTDNGSGAGGAALEDDNSGETATANVTIGGLTSTGSDVDAERSWTLRDTVTGEEFEVVEFEVEDGPASGTYLLSEIPLVPGRSYVTLAYDTNPDADAGDPAFTYADYDFPTPDGVVDGTSGDDVIDADYTGDPDGDVIDGNDAPSAAPPTPLQFNWTDYGDEANLAGGVSQNTGGIQVDVGFTGPAGSEFSAEHTSQYTGGGPFSPNSGAYLFQNGNATNAEVTFDFSANAGSGFEDAVENVSFRINDIDGVSDGFNNFRDILTITAFDADGNEVAVSITAAGDDTVTGQTVTGTLTNNSETQAAGSVLVQIAGPVARIVVDYDNGGNTQQAVFFTDLHFQAVPLGSDDDLIRAGAGNDVVDAGYGDDEVYGEAGDDTLTGGSGADTLDGGAGNDTLNVGAGDTATGGDGDDTFVVDATVLGGGTITVIGGEGDETTGDTLDFNGQLAGPVSYSNLDDGAGGKSGTATLIDGTVVNFTEIEHIICFAEGTLIETVRGPRAVQDLAAGDLVLTADDGPQPIRWHGRRTVVGTGQAAPILIAEGALGNARPLIVSPQHRMLIDDHRAQLYFGEDAVLVPAKALTDGCCIVEAPCERVTYHHLMLDRHAIITAEGALTETYHPGAYSLDGLEEASREDLFRVFPGLRGDVNAYGPLARKTIRARAGRVLAA